MGSQTLEPVGGLVPSPSYSSNVFGTYTIRSSPYYYRSLRTAIYDIRSLGATSVDIDVRCNFSNSDGVSTTAVCYLFPLASATTGTSVTLTREKLFISDSVYASDSYYSGKFTFSLDNFGSDDGGLTTSGDDGTVPYMAIVFSAGAECDSIEFTSVSVDVSGDSGGSTPTPEQVKVTATPSSPSGGGTSFSSNVTFSWRISPSPFPEGVVYAGTRIQVSTSNDQFFNNLIWDYEHRNLATQCEYTEGRLQANTDYIWRAKAVITGGDSDIETPWSDATTFKTKDYETVNVSVTTLSPKNNAPFTSGTQIQFSWSINAGSGISISSSTLFIDGSPYRVINGAGTSYTLTEEESKNFENGTHRWSVSVSCSSSSSGIFIAGSTTSEEAYFKIDPPTVTATPRSPSGTDAVGGDVPVKFQWSLSANGEGTVTGSQVEFRTRNSNVDESPWQLAGETEHGEDSLLYEPGFTPNTVVEWRVRASLDYVWGKWSNEGTTAVTFTVGAHEETIYQATPTIRLPKSPVLGSGEITFAWIVKCDSVVTDTYAEYSIDGGLNWIRLKSPVPDGEGYTITLAKNEILFPAKDILWRVFAKSNGDYSEVESSFSVTYDAYGAVKVADGPISNGFRIDLPLVITAELETVGTTTETITFTSVDFCWRMDADSDFTAVAMNHQDGKRAIRTFRQNYFPSTGILQWYLRAKDSKENESETPLYCAYILKSSIDSFPISPIGKYFQASEEIEFQWGYIAQNNNRASHWELSFSYDKVNWEDPVSLQGSISGPGGTVYDPQIALAENLFTATTKVTFIENYFSAGKIYWRVRNTASDGALGEWGYASAPFVILGAPLANEFQCDGKPFATFSWNSNGQISYTISIDEQFTYGPFYGDVQSFTLPEPLDDGVHAAYLQLQNQLGVFSDWFSTKFTVENTPSVSTVLELKIRADIDALLSWTPVVLDDRSQFLVYRDNTLIARLTSDSVDYQDRLALGEHTYRVIQKLPSNYYNLYTHAPVTMSSNTTRVTRLSGGPWISLSLTSEQYPTNDFTYSRVVEKTHIMGTDFPVFEVSDFEEAHGEYEYVWPYASRNQAKMFRDLVGEAIIIKSRAEQLICGVLESCTISINSQVVKCKFTLEQMSLDEDLSIAIKPELDNGYMTNLDLIYFGQMSEADLGLAVTNPGYTNPKYYEGIAEAINEVKRDIYEKLNSKRSISDG